MVEQHLEKHTFTESIEVPAHEARKESLEFAHAKHRLIKEGKHRCFICDTEESVEVHHFILEWSLANTADYDAVKALCELWDFYGYAKEMQGESITSPR